MFCPLQKCCQSTDPRYIPLLSSVSFGAAGRFIKVVDTHQAVGLALLRAHVMAVLGRAMAWVNTRDAGQRISPSAAIMIISPKSDSLAGE